MKRIIVEVRHIIVVDTEEVRVYETIIVGSSSISSKLVVQDVVVE